MGWWSSYYLKGKYLFQVCLISEAWPLIFALHFIFYQLPYIVLQGLRGDMLRVRTVQYTREFWGKRKVCKFVPSAGGAFNGPSLHLMQLWKARFFFLLLGLHWPQNYQDLHWKKIFRWVKDITLKGEPCPTSTAGMWSNHFSEVTMTISKLRKSVHQHNRVCCTETASRVVLIFNFQLLGKSWKQEAAVSPPC